MTSEKRKKQVREAMARYRKTQKYRDYIKKYQQSDKYKDYQKEYEHSKKRKEWKKNYEKTPQRKKYIKEWRQKNPDKIKKYSKIFYNKPKRQKYLKKFWKSPIGKQVRSKANRETEGKRRNLKNISLMPNIFPKDIKVDFHHILNDFYSEEKQEWFTIPLPRQTHLYKSGFASNHEHWIHNTKWIKKIYCIDIKNLLDENKLTF